MSESSQVSTWWSVIRGSFTCLTLLKFLLTRSCGTYFTKTFPTEERCSLPGAGRDDANQRAGVEGYALVIRDLVRPVCSADETRRTSKDVLAEQWVHVKEEEVGCGFRYFGEILRLGRLVLTAVSKLKLRHWHDHLIPPLHMTEGYHTKTSLPALCRLELVLCFSRLERDWAGSAR